WWSTFSGWILLPEAQTRLITTRQQRKSIWWLRGRAKWWRAADWTASRVVTPPKRGTPITSAPTARWGSTNRRSRGPKPTFWQCERRSHCPRMRTDVALAVASGLARDLTVGFAEGSYRGGL